MGAVRRASNEDVDKLLPLLRAMHAESGFREIPIEEKKLRYFVTFCISNPNHCCLVYESAPATIDGVMIGYATQYFFSTELGAWDLLLYVRPERRGSLIAYRLWKAFKDWAKNAGARLMWLGTSADIAPGLTRKFYTGLGMTESGTLYRLPV